jgi:hypothetical protein
MTVGGDGALTLAKKKWVGASPYCWSSTPGTRTPCCARRRARPPPRSPRGQESGLRHGQGPGRSCHPRGRHHGLPGVAGRPHLEGAALAGLPTQVEEAALSHSRGLGLEALPEPHPRARPGLQTGLKGQGGRRPELPLEDAVIQQEQREGQPPACALGHLPRRDHRQGDGVVV